MLYERSQSVGVDPVLILLSTLGVGGSETKFVRLTNTLVGQGAPLHLGYFNPPETLRAEIDGNVPVLNLERRGKYSIGSLRRLRDYVASRRIRTLVTVNDYPLAYAVPVRSWRLVQRPRVIASINTTYVTERRERMFMLLYRQLLRRVDQIVYGCQQQRGHWCRTYDLDPSRSTVIYNGVDCDYFDARETPGCVTDPRRRFGIPADARLIVCVGQLRPEKAQWLLVEALARLQRQHDLEPHLVLVGDGPERQRIERLAAELGLASRVHLAGAVTDVRPYLRAADVFALSSVTETFSNAALEAGAMSLPVVASDTGGAAEMFRSEQDGGLIYPASDVSTLASRLASLIADPERSRRLGERARHTVRERFRRELMVTAWRRILWPQGGGYGTTQTSTGSAVVEG